MNIKTKNHLFFSGTVEIAHNCGAGQFAYNTNIYIYMFFPGPEGQVSIGLFSLNFFTIGKWLIL